MNLRLWSGTQPFDDLLVEFPGPPVHLHRKGETVHLLASGRPHVPRRHYATFRAAHAENPGAIEAWINDEIAKLDRRILTSELIRMGVVEAVFWIAIFGDSPTTPPTLSAPLVEQLRAAGARALIENYSPPAPEAPIGAQPADAERETKCPTRIWYPPDATGATTPSHTP